jgi:hypothetical protein
MVLSIGCGPAPKGVGIKIRGGPWEAFPCFPGVKAQEVFYSNVRKSACDSCTGPSFDK